MVKQPNFLILAVLLVGLGFCAAGGVENVHHARKDAEKSERTKEVLREWHQSNAHANEILKMVREYQQPYGDVLDLAPVWRQRNRGGSCVHASTVMNLRWLGLYKQADKWWASYRGGESSGPHRRKMDQMGLKYRLTTDGDAKIFQLGMQTRRGVLCTAYGAHMIWWIGTVKRSGETYSVILDNNRIGEFRYQRWGDWMRNFRRCGGWGVVILSGSPPPPTPT